MGRLSIRGETGGAARGWSEERDWPRRRRGREEGAMWAGPGGAARRAVPGVWGQRERGGVGPSPSKHAEAAAGPIRADVYWCFPAAALPASPQRDPTGSDPAPNLRLPPPRQRRRCSAEPRGTGRDSDLPTTGRRPQPPERSATGPVSYPTAPRQRPDAAPLPSPP